MADLVTLATFENQVYLLEKVKIHIDCEFTDIMLPRYKYKGPFPNKNYRLKDLKVKRLNNYLANFHYYFYDRNIHDYIDDSFLIYDVRQKSFKSTNS